MTAGTESASVRIDRWLWFARFLKTRSGATRLVSSGKVRVNRQIIAKAHHALRIGDVLTFPQGNDIRVVEVRALGSRRGPATEARELYRDLSPPAPKARAVETAGAREPGAGRPTKAERRAIDRLRGRR